jgi:hypothetical protein
MGHVAPAIDKLRLPDLKARTMITKLEAPLRRELSIDGQPHVLTITPDGFLLTQKGRRKGHEMTWRAFVSGEAALATALNASIASAPPARRSAQPHAATNKGATARRTQKAAKRRSG